MRGGAGGAVRGWGTSRGSGTGKRGVRGPRSSSFSPTSKCRPNCWRQWCAPISVRLVSLSAALRVVGKHNHVARGMSSNIP